MQLPEFRTRREPHENRGLLLDLQMLLLQTLGPGTIGSDARTGCRHCHMTTAVITEITIRAASTTMFSSSTLSMIPQRARIRRLRAGR